LEPRLIVAYSLIATLLVIGSGAAVVVRRQRARRRRRLRGIKDHPTAPQGRRLA
jgi:hypothetical protein